MDVEVIAIGSELVRHGRIDTNSDWLIERLQASGLEVRARCAVDDEIARLERVVRAAWQRGGAVLLTGGLGPTEDDRTREAVARALGLSLETDDACAERLRRLYDRYGRPFGAAEARQAMRPAGATWIANSLGSAPGLLIEGEGRLLAALPGVPAEMRSMFEADVLPRLRRSSPGCLGRCCLRVAGRTEGSIERQMSDLYRLPGIDVTVLSGAEGLELHARARGVDDEEVAARLAAFEKATRDRLGADLYGANDDRLPAVVGAALMGRGSTLATAESCTGGLLGAALTSVPGSSAWYRGGLVVYSNELKSALAGVDEGLLAAQGAVSEAVARALARGAADRCGADVGIGITGIAGPGGGSAAKPVGSVHLAIQDGKQSVHWELHLVGDREMVRGRAVTVALDRLRRRLLERA